VSITRGDLYDLVGRSDSLATLNKETVQFRAIVIPSEVEESAVSTGMHHDRDDATQLAIRSR